MDPSVIIESENSKQRLAMPEGISFESNPQIRDNPELIAYISSKTGKMKPLAISDLESHLQLAQQFLNIGKPFLFEGIGTISKTRSGEFEFIPGTVITEKIKEAAEETPGLSKKETVDAKYQAYLATPSTQTWWKKPVIALLVLSGIGLAIWGGYTISAKNAENDETDMTETISGPTLGITDSSQLNATDVTALQSPSLLTSTDSYKYVLEVAKSTRAFKRFNQLRENSWKVQLETSDSVQYKLFLLLPSTADTTRTLDSLTVMTGRRVYIEPQN